MTTRDSGRVVGRVAFVTGAARGQGRSHAVLLAREGADIIAVDICAPVASVPYPLANAADLDETVRLVEAEGGRIVAQQADVRDRSALAEALQAGVAEFGRLDIVIANAGVANYARATDLTPEAWTEMIDINLNGVWWTVQESLPHLIAGARGGSIVITSSTAGLRGLQNCVHYVAAKHGVVGMMRGLALELAKHNIRVNSVHPGNVNTDMIHNPSTYELFLPGREKPTSAEFERVTRTLHPMPVPWVEAANISDAVLFLASESASMVTGVTLPVDAGLAAHW
jgi:SDR family mycofactocin-dependent oxidoreductase